MLLHEAVQAARKELRLSQKKLAEQAGIQRRQLATLEKGGNITLATLRKVLAHLPNLETFTIDAVAATVRRDVPPDEQQQVVTAAIEMMTTAMAGLSAALAAGRTPGEREMKAFDAANEVLYTGLGYTRADIRREADRIRLHHFLHPEVAKGPAADFVEALDAAEVEAEELLRKAGIGGEGEEK